MPLPETLDPAPRESVLAETLRLGMPAMLGMLSQWVLNLADIHMVGRLAHGATAQRGAESIANVHVGTIFILAMLFTFGALSIGTQAVAARRWGERNHAAAERAMTSGLILAMALSAILLPVYQLIVPWIVETFSPSGQVLDTGVVTGYLRTRFWAIPALLALFVMRGWFNGVGSTAVVMVSALFVNALNILLNWCWIEGHWGFARLEVEGAALASAVATWMGVVFLVVYALTSRRCVEIGLLRRWSIDRALLLRIARLSLPSFIHLGALHTGFLVFHGFIIPRTAEGTAAVAASGIAWNSASLCFFVSYGFGIAAATMLGQGLGSGAIQRARHCVWTACFLGYGGNLMLAVVYVLFGRRIAALFNADPEVIRLTFWLFVIVASFQVLDNFGIILSEAFKGAGMTLFVMLVEVPVNLMFLVIAWILGVQLDLGVIGAWMAMIVYAIVFALIMIVSFRRGLWQRARA